MLTNRDSFANHSRIALARVAEMIGRTYFEKGKPAVVLARWNGKGPRNVLIRRADGSEVIRPVRGLRKPAP